MCNPCTPNEAFTNQMAGKRSSVVACDDGDTNTCVNNVCTHDTDKYPVEGGWSTRHASIDYHLPSPAAERPRCCLHHFEQVW